MSGSGWGIIGFGEAGSAFARQIAGALSVPVRVMDPLLNQAEPPVHIRRQLAAASVLITPTIAELMAECQIVLSLVTARGAASVAREASAIASGALFVDLNSIGPDEKRRLSDGFDDQRYVDGAILGAISAGVDRIPIALAGPRSPTVRERFISTGLRPTILDGDVGSASALKMCRSVFMKGIECLLVETMLAATRFGVGPAVLASIEQTWNAAGFEAMTSMLITTHAVHCARRADEMAHVSHMLAEMQVPHTMADAALERLAASARAALPEQFGGVIPDDPGTVITYLGQMYSQGGES